MLSIPNRLLDSSFIHCYFQNHQVVFLQKELKLSLVERHSYLSMHALSFVEEGVQELELSDGTVFRVMAGEIVCLQRGIYTISDLLVKSQSFKSHIIFFTDELLNEVLLQHIPQTNNLANVEQIFKVKAPSYVYNYWNGIKVLSEAYGTVANLYYLKFKELLTVLFAAWPNALEQFSGLTQPKQQGLHLQTFMNQYFDQPFTIADYAYLMGQSESTFRRVFKSKYGIAPKKWIIQKRMKKGEALLKNKEYTVQQIAKAVGYENTSHFIKAFKKYYGYTPKQQAININFDGKNVF